MMKPLFSKRSTVVLLVLMLLFVSSACLAFGSPTSPTQAPAAGSPVTTGQPSAFPSVVPTQGDVIRTVVIGPGAFNLTDPAVGLVDLTSYTATLTLSFDGTQAGQPQKWLRKYVMLSTQKPAAHQLTIEQSGDASQPAQVFKAELDGATYERLDQNSCTANAFEPEDSLAKVSEPAGFLTGVLGAEAAGSETVNDTAADHYKFDERSLLGQLGLAKSTGEIWIASQGGYVVRYLLTTTAGPDYFGDGIEGTQTWDYELTGANQPVSIEIPVDCPAGVVDALLLPDASNVESVPGMLSFDTSTSLADTTAFYLKQLPTLGWKVAEGGSDNPDLTGASIVLDFARPGQSPVRSTATR